MDPCIETFLSKKPLSCIIIFLMLIFGYMNTKKLEKIILLDLKQAKFRLKQAQKLIFQDLIDDWEQASVFSKNLRDDLNKLYPLDIKAEILVSKDKKSAKALITLSDGKKVETALMVHNDDRNTACLSSQVGCPLSCKFCASGMSFSRNLTDEEIIMQALFWARYLKKNNLGRLSNIVFMGMGEPFLNYDNVFSSIAVFNNPDFFNISDRKISISTSGLIEGIRKMASEEHQVNLAISLHFVNDKMRAVFMPIAKKYPLKKLFSVIEYYVEKTNRKVMFEYMLIKGKNDSPKDAENLASLMKPLYMVNLLKYNKIKDRDFESPDNKAMDHFSKLLRQRGVEVVERYRFNQDVFGACGQLGTKL